MAHITRTEYLDLAVFELDLRLEVLYLLLVQTAFIFDAHFVALQVVESLFFLLEVKGVSLLNVVEFLLDFLLFLGQPVVGLVDLAQLFPEQLHLLLGLVERHGLFVRVIARSRFGPIVLAPHRAPAALLHVFLIRAAATTSSCILFALKCGVGGGLALLVVAVPVISAPRPRSVCARVLGAAAVGLDGLQWLFGSGFVIGFPGIALASSGCGVGGGGFGYFG